MSTTKINNFVPRQKSHKIRENWVPIDIIHILYQMGFDVFARLKEM